MRTSRIGTTYIILVWVLVILMLGIVLTIGYLRNIHDLQHLMSEEAEQLIGVVTISARASIHSLDEVEDLTAARLLDNAHLIEQIVEDHGVDPVHLTKVIQENNLHMVNILNPQGVSVLRISDVEDIVSDGNLSPHHEAVRRVLEGESTEEVIGFMESNYYTGQRYGVVVARRSGGAVVVNANSDQMLDFRKSVGLGTLFREIGSQAGVRYAVLQDTVGIVAASAGVDEMTRLQDDTFLMSSLAGMSGTRFFDGNGERVFEIVQSFEVDDVNLGLIRIGMNIEQFEAIRIRALRQFMILFIAAAFSGAFLLVYIMLRQNYRVLNREHDRILGEVRQMEEERRRSERLTSMGRLAAGVAHEIRNPLNSISMITQRLRAEFKPTGDIDEYNRFLMVIAGEIDRIKVIIENFLKYVKPPKLDKQSVNLEKLATDAVAVVTEKARASEITLEVTIPGSLNCQCDTEQMKQALLNLLLNALDAADNGGVVEITARRNGTAIEIMVTDSGKGIAADILPNIFDPYFTTKDHGSGLGLSEVHRIISAHNGSISAGNIPGSGAVFKILLPATGDHV